MGIKEDWKQRERGAYSENTKKRFLVDQSRRWKSKQWWKLSTPKKSMMKQTNNSHTTLQWINLPQRSISRSRKWTETENHKTGNEQQTKGRASWLKPEKNEHLN